MRSLLLWGALIALVAFLVGFWNFAETVRQDVEEPAPAQAIVALTGGSLERLTTGVRLLEEHKGERLLISGVNRIVTDAELLDALDADASLGACCIDVGRSAEDTLGNASETAAWAREHRYTNIILVTDDYHMPRSRAELEAALPEAVISSVNWAEVVQKSIAAGVNVDGLREDLEALGLRILPFTAEEAEIAAQLWQQTRSVGLSLGDRACLSVAIRLETVVLTADQIWTTLSLPIAVHSIR